MCIYVYTYIIHTYTHTYAYIYIYIYVHYTEGDITQNRGDKALGGPQVPCEKYI